jgi:hypothetical protein
MNVRYLRATCVAIVLVLTGASHTVQAQDRARTAQAPKKKRAKAPKPEAPPPAASDVPVPTAEDAADAPAPPPVASEREGEVRKEGGSEVKVLEFSGLDIEGQLKTPQMLYFLRRLRAEFGRPHLPHRSFLPELELTTKDEEF